MGGIGLVELLALLTLGFLCRPAEAADLDIRQVGTVSEFTADGRLVLRYHQPPEAAKPFIDPLLTPAGHSVTTARSAQLHHHGLWFTWGGLMLATTGETVSFWQEGGDPASTGEVVMRPGSRGHAWRGKGSVALTTEYEWRRKSDGLVLLTERREIGLLDSGSNRANLVTITSEQTAARDLVISHQSNERVAYYGLALQMPSDMNYGLVVNSQGGEGRAGVEGLGAPWCAHATNVSPARGVAIFDHPDNPRYPNAWFTLDNAFLSTSLVALEDYPLKAGETLRLRYGVLAFDGDLDAKLIRQQYSRWLRYSSPATVTGRASSSPSSGG